MPARRAGAAAGAVRQGGDPGGLHAGNYAAAHGVDRRVRRQFGCAPRDRDRHSRQATWSETNPDGRWRCFDYADIIKRDKVNLDIFWLKDKSLEDADDLPTPDILAQEIADDLLTALEQFAAIAGELK